MASGIYMIYNILNGKFYIGSSFNIEDRFRVHKYKLNNNYHHSKYLQNAWNKYSGWRFEFYIIEYCSIDKLLEREQWWLNLTECYNPKIGYNVCSVVDSPLGYKHSEETKLKMRGRIRSKEHAEKISRKGKTVSENGRRNMALARTGKPNLSTRNFEKWSCPDGWICKCQKCKSQRYNLYYSLEARNKNKELKNAKNSNAS